MERTARQLIREREVLPRIVLPRADGQGAMALSGQQASLLVFVHPAPCEACNRFLVELAGAVDDLRAWATRPLAVAAEGDTAGDHPFPFLVDEDGAARRRLGIGEDEAAVILADQWGEVFEVATFGAAHGFPLAGHVVESAKIVDLSCGECNVPGPEWRRPDD
jgi:hypothetical protein